MGGGDEWKKKGRAKEGERKKGRGTGEGEERKNSVRIPVGGLKNRKGPRTKKIHRQRAHKIIKKLK